MLAAPFGATSFVEDDRELLPQVIVEVPRIHCHVIGPSRLGWRDGDAVGGELEALRALLQEHDLASRWQDDAHRHVVPGVPIEVAGGNRQAIRIFVAHDDRLGRRKLIRLVVDDDQLDERFVELVIDHGQLFDAITIEIACGGRAHVRGVDPG